MTGSHSEDQVHKEMYAEISNLYRFSATKLLEVSVVHQQFTCITETNNVKSHIESDELKMNNCCISHHLFLLSKIYLFSWDENLGYLKISISAATTKKRFNTLM